MRRVVLLCRDGLQGPLGNPILHTPGFQVASFDDPEKVSILLKSEEADLLIWEQWGRVEDDIQSLWRIMRNLVNPLLRSLCIWKDPIPQGLPPFVHQSFRHPLDFDEFTHVLGLFVVDRPNRKDRRFHRRVMFRLHSYPPSGEGKGILCSSVDVSISGALLESNQPLQVGLSYDAELIGVSAGRVRSVRVLVLRETPNPGHSFQRQYACRFEGLKPEDKTQLRATLGL